METENPIRKLFSLTGCQLALRIILTIGLLIFLAGGIVMIVLGVMYGILPIWIIGITVVVIGLIILVYAIENWIKYFLPDLLKP